MFLPFEEIKRLPFFSSLDWSFIHSHPPPFVPRPDDITDTTYFDGKFISSKIDALLLDYWCL